MSESLRFRRLGRAWHPCVDDGHALAGVLELDEALWIATAAPVGTLRADPELLACLDADRDGRIRTDEVRAAIRWLLANLRDPADIRTGNTSLRLAGLPDESHALLAAARLVLERSSAPAADGADDVVTLAAVREVRAAERARGLAEAGCVRPSAAVEVDLARFLAHIVETTGGAPHPALAVTTASMSQFLDEARAWTVWHERGVPDTGNADVLPLGSATPAAWRLCESLAAKLDQYFVLCDAVRLDPRFATRLADDAFAGTLGVDLCDVAATTSSMERAPLAPPRADGRLALGAGVNPAYHDQVTRLLEEVIRPLLGGTTDTLDRATWADVRTRLAPYAAWMGERPTTRIGERGAAEIKAHTDDPTLVVRAQGLLDASHVMAERIGSLRELEQLILYQAWMLPFVDSFVTCRGLYEPGIQALFGWGTLVLDGRWFRLAVKVPDAVRHEAFMRRGALCVMYVEIGDHDGAWDYEVAIPVTAGTQGVLVEGMWGVFVEHTGRERHARVRKIVVHPISLRDAVFSPFRRLLDALQGAVDKAGSAQEAAQIDQALAGARAGLAMPVAPLPVPVVGAPPATKSAATGVLAIAAGAGIALAAVSSALAYISDRFVAAASTIGGWIIALPIVTALPAGTAHTVGLVAYPIAVVVVIASMLAVPLLTYLVPVCIAAWLKLRRRDLGSLLIGSGWAINTRLYLTRDVVHVFTQEPSVARSQRRG